MRARANIKLYFSKEYLEPQEVILNIIYLVEKVHFALAAQKTV